MAIDRALWSGTFEKFPAWNCPTCHRAALKLLEGSLKTVETGPSVSAHDHEAWEPDWNEYRFTALMQCQSGECGDLVAVSGSQTAQVFQIGQNDWSVTEEYHPRHLFPAPSVFPIPPECPQVVADELRQAFSLYWFDTGSSANRLRAAVEALLTERGVARVTIARNRRNRISLHQRIERFQGTHPDAAECLMAIKWLGNLGSHAGLDVDEASLLDGFELFEHALDLLYVRKAARMKKVAKGMVARKGRAPRRT